MHTSIVANFQPWQKAVSRCKPWVMLIGPAWSKRLEWSPVLHAYW